MDKKTDERLLMQYFREKYDHFPKGKLIESESPDFILKLNRRKSIGIELTRLDYLLENDSDNPSEMINKLIQKKEDKLRLYKKRILNEYWLIISIESRSLDEIPTTDIQQVSNYTKVFLFDVFKGKINELI